MSSAIEISVPALIEFNVLGFLLFRAAIAQLGELQTEDLKLPGSIPGLGMLHAAQCCAWLSKAPAPCAMLRAVLAACP